MSASASPEVFGAATLYVGDCLDVMRSLDAETFHACVCDPPYHLTSIVKRFGGDNPAPAQFGRDGAYARASAGFMGKQWDGGDIALRPETWAEVLRVLKPGAHLLAFGGTRTFHRMAVAIEDAGFEIRDCLMWLYGSGFPKSHNQPGGWGTALKPAWEPIVLARKPLIGTVAANLAAHGTGAVNIDACRVEAAEPLGGGKTSAAYVGCKDGWRRPFQDDPTYMAKRADVEAGKVARAESLGRWPANVVHDGSDEVEAAFAAFRTDKGQTGPEILTRSSAKFGAVYAPMSGTLSIDAMPHDRPGTASRFFYSAKADATDRAGSKHPTVKPLDLMRYLVRLVTPPKGHVLDCFAGSGTTGEAALLEGFRATLIEREAEYADDIRSRLQRPAGADLPLFAGAP